MTGGRRPSAAAARPRGHVCSQPCHTGDRGASQPPSLLPCGEHVWSSLHELSPGSALWRQPRFRSSARVWSRRDDQGPLLRAPVSTGPLGACHLTWGSECPSSSQIHLLRLPAPTVPLQCQKIPISGLVFSQTSWGGGWQTSFALSGVESGGDSPLGSFQNAGQLCQLSSSGWIFGRKAKTTEKAPSNALFYHDRVRQIQSYCQGPEQGGPRPCTKLKSHEHEGQWNKLPGGATGWQHTCGARRSRQVKNRGRSASGRGTTRAKT